MSCFAPRSWLLAYASVFFAILCLASAQPAGAVSFPCGEDGCQIETGTYYLALPSEGAPEKGTVVYFHGFGGKAHSLMRMGGLVEIATDRGYAVLALQGQEIDGRSRWRVPSADGGGSTSGRDDDSFVLAVLAEAKARFGVRDNRVLVSGFSLGGMYAWHLACRMGDRFTAFAPVAGVIWEPLPESCSGGPLSVLHTHGFADGTVPLEGRSIRDGAIIQGDVFAMLDIARQHNGCTQEKPSRFSTIGAMQCRHWEECPRGEISFCLHPGAHSIPKGWASMALDWFEGLEE